jgi:predicted regulator of Ras-like GTPase activity (Roadblock/LC7/MglB family)
MSDQSSGRAARLDRALADLLAQAPELEAAAVVSFDGLPMASRLPGGMNEDRVAAMSAALLSLGEKAAQGLGRGDLSQVYVEGETGTVFLVSCRDQAVLVAVAAVGAKAGLMLYEVRRAAADLGEILLSAPVVESPGAVDDDALAQAEAAYQAYRAEQERLAAERATALLPPPTGAPLTGLPSLAEAVVAPPAAGDPGTAAAAGWS